MKCDHLDSKNVSLFNLSKVYNLDAVEKNLDRYLCPITLLVFGIDCESIIHPQQIVICVLVC